MGTGTTRANLHMSDRGNTPDNPWKQAARRIGAGVNAEPAQQVADKIAEVVARAREACIDDQMILAQLQHTADVLRERLI